MPIPSLHSWGVASVWEPPSEEAMNDLVHGSYDLEQWRIDNFRECGIEDENKPWIRKDDSENT